MPKIVSANLSKKAFSIYKQLRKIRAYGWLSKEFSDYLIQNYGNEKKLLLGVLNDLQQERNEIEKKIQGIVKQIKKLK